MANLVLFGAEWGSSAEPDGLTYSPATFSNTIKRSGDYSFKTYNQQGFWFAIPNKDELYVQYAFYVENYFYSATRHFRAWGNGGPPSILVTDFDSNNHLRVYLGDRSTLIITSSTVFQVGRWYVVELHMKIADSGGIVELRVDGVHEGSFSGDTKPGTATTIDGVGVSLDVGVGMVAWIDDFIVNDISGSVNNSWPNGDKIALLRPNADAGVNQWTPSSGSDHYAVIDEVPPSAADSLSTLTADAKEVLSLGDLPAAAESVSVVQAQTWCFKGSFVDPDRLKIGVNIGGTDYLSSALDLPISAGIKKNALDTNPAGGNWDVATVNAAKLTIQAVN